MQEPQTSSQRHLDVPSGLVRPYNAVIPMVIENDGRTERSFDIYSRLLRDRIVFVGTPIDDQVANAVVAQLLFLQSADPEKDILMYINSPGGVVTAGLAIYDTMQYIKPDVSTICVGQAMSMGAVLLAGGAKKKRFALPNAEILIHQPHGGVQGQASDIAIHAKNILKTREKLNKLLAKHTGQSLEQVTLDTDRDHYYDADEAKAYGLIDDIILTVEQVEERQREQQGKEVA